MMISHKFDEANRERREDTLQLKHLAPYLPYGLKIRRTTKLDYQKGTAHEFDEVKLTHGDFLQVVLGNSHPNFDCKPLLHPLSRLTEPMGFDKNNISYAAELKLFTRADVEWVIQSPLGCDYQTIQKLLEWHFDVFGLIEKGLALEKPIKE